ncbi:MAG: sulfatase-like hydrolase/transferase, partial [Candidatus Omnitrophota bacterium]
MITFRRILVLGGAIAFAVVCFFAGYAKYNPSWGRYNVLVITLDTLRPDRLGCYGNKNIQTPNIDRLAAHGTLFKNAFSQAPLTLPSHAALFTSTYPPHNQVRDNGNCKLDESALTLAEILK